MRLLHKTSPSAPCASSFLQSLDNLASKIVRLLTFATVSYVYGSTRDRCLCRGGSSYPRRESAVRCDSTPLELPGWWCLVP